MRVRRVTGALVAGLLLLAGCSAGGSGGASVSMAQVGRAVSADRMLHWTGSWRWTDRTVTVDLDTLGSGDGLGTVTVAGHRGRLLFGQGRMFVRAAAGFWRASGENKADAARMGRGWADAGDLDLVDDPPPFDGLDLAMLTPGGLGKRLGGPARCANRHAQRAATGRTAARASGARPAGVPAGALRLDAPGGCEKGVYWVSATGTHQLLAYRGPDQPAADWSADLVNAGEVTGTRLTVRVGSTAQARTEYLNLAAAAATVPDAVEAGPGAEDEVSTDVEPADVDKIGACMYAGCPHLDLVVTVDNTSDVVTASIVVTARVLADKRTVGVCRLPKHVLAPSARHSWPCPVTDSRMATMGSAREGNFAASCAFHSLTEVSHASDLAGGFRTAARRLG